MKLNRTGSNWNRLERNKINENWDIIEGNHNKLEGEFNDVVGKITDEVVGHLIDSAKLIWKEPVDTVEDLPASAEVGETRMVREADPDGISYVYRYDGENWEKIQEIDVTLVNEVDSRLTEQLVETGDRIFNESLINHKRQRGMITILDDDGFSKFYDWMYPLALEYNIPMTSAVITEWVLDGRVMSVDQVKEIYENGIEIVNHTHTHPHLDQLSESEIKYEFSECERILDSWGIKNHDIIVYPFGSSNKLVRDVAREYFVAGFDIPRGGTYGQLNDYPMDNYNIRRTTIGMGFTQGLKDELDKAAADGKWIIVMSHINQNTAQNKDNYEATMRSLIEYAQGLGLEFVTCREGLRSHGNLAQFGGTRIGANGKVESDELLITDYSKYSHTTIYRNNNPITDYPIGRKIVFNVRDQEANEFGLPEGRGGVIETYRGVENHFSYQQFTPRYQDRPRLIRKWDNVNNVWREWESVSFTRNATEADYTPNAPITDFPKGEIVKITMTVSKSGDYLITPVINRAEAGIIEVHRAPSNVSDDYSFQLFHANSSNIVLKRKWSTVNGDWNRWFVVNSLVNPRDHTIAIDALVSAYPVGQIVVTKVMEVDSHLLGVTRTGQQVGGYGLLETYAFSEYNYSYQKYFDRKNLKSYIRWWGGSAWSGWVEQTNT